MEGRKMRWLITGRQRRLDFSALDFSAIQKDPKTDRTENRVAIGSVNSRMFFDGRLMNFDSESNRFSRAALSTGSAQPPAKQTRLPSVGLSESVGDDPGTEDINLPPIQTDPQILPNVEC